MTLKALIQYSSYVKLNIMLLLCSTAVFAQQATPRVLTAAQLDFFKYLLISVGGAQIDPNVAKHNLSAISTLYGLNDQETSLLASAGQSFRAAVTAFQASEASLLAGKQAETDSDRAAFARLSVQVDDAVGVLANQILSGLRPERVTLLLLQPDILQFVGKKQGGN